MSFKEYLAAVKTAMKNDAPRRFEMSKQSFALVVRYSFNVGETVEEAVAIRRAVRDLNN